jgi:pseudouridine-5'-phosphate glycosidase
MIQRKLSIAVENALQTGWPVVALESTLVSHGLRWPTNLETGRAAEAAVRDAGATPATTALIDGELRVGLDERDLERLARGEGIAKSSRRDLAWLAAQGKSAGTTVAATMFIARRAGIPIMATGGIGGVHRGAETTWDVSADLIELSRTPVAVVCSGAKSILDLPRTLEFLETHGVAVIGYGTSEFPAFFAETSGLRLDARVDTPDEAAAVIRASRAIGSPSGIVIANPPPRESAVPRDVVDRLIHTALATAGAAGVRGKALTPFLLRTMREIDGDDRLLRANRALIVANARLAGQIARSLCAAQRR